MITEILAGSLISILSFGIGMKYQERKQNKAQVDSLLEKLEEMKQHKPLHTDTQKEMLNNFLKSNFEAILAEENPEKAIREWLAFLDSQQKEGNSANGGN